MTEFADLEMGIHRRDVASYTIDVRYSQPNSDTDVRLSEGQDTEVVFDVMELNALSEDPPAYAQALTKAFFAGQAVQTTFAQARSTSEALGAGLRVRLMIGSSASELQDLHWELLCDPQRGTLLSTSENVLLSRYLSSLDWRRVRLRPRKQLRALALIANPSDLADYQLAPIVVADELARARGALGDIPLDVLSGQDSDHRATLNNLAAGLRDGEYDILYVVCHGSLVKHEPWLWFEEDQGKTARISGTHLAAQLNELQMPPRLVVLASCESAGASAGDALAALGPRLAQAGIAAVVAMQDRISIETVAEFMPVFFSELRRDGQIDRAMSAARGSVRDHPDHWVPVLFMRLKSGRIWYVPGFTDEGDEFDKWDSLALFVKDRNCTPILGPALIDDILGSRRDVAVKWAEQHGFPLASHERENMQAVAQYVMTHQSPAYLPAAYRDALQEAILRRYQAALPTDLRQEKRWSVSQLQQTLRCVGERHSTEHPGDPYTALARLRLPIYVTTSTLDFMTDALVRAGAQPVVRLAPWNKWIPKEKAIYEDEPTPEKPLVYHLYGHASVLNSPVLAEDQYFDYLIGITQNKSLIPTAVRAALSNTSLLFLGFQMDDWEFRVFFRFLMAQEGRESLKLYSHAAAQIEPEEDRLVNVKRARRYLEEYFNIEQISIYWGSTEEFLKDLWQHL